MFADLKYHYARIRIWGAWAKFLNGRANEHSDMLSLDYIRYIMTVTQMFILR